MDLRQMKKTNKKVKAKVKAKQSKAKTAKLKAINDLEKFYKLINKVQMNNKPVKLVVLEIDSAVYENILKDLELVYDKKIKKVKNQQFVLFTVNNSEKKQIHPAFDNIEPLPDEFFEDGQLFGI
jgi:hypothetical protein